MIKQNVRKIVGIGLAASLLTGAFAILGQSALAQDTQRPSSQEGAQAQPRRPRQPGQPGQPGGGEFQGGGGFGGGQGGPGGFGGPGGGPGGFGGPGGGGFGGPPGMMGGGGAAMTATTQAVYILRGNQLLAYDARTLNLLKAVELPRPQMGPGGEGGGPGGPGGGRPQRPGGEGN